MEQNMLIEIITSRFPIIGRKIRKIEKKLRHLNENTSDYSEAISQKEQLLECSSILFREHFCSIEFEKPVSKKYKLLVDETYYKIYSDSSKNLLVNFAYL